MNGRDERRGSGGSQSVVGLVPPPRKDDVLFGGGDDSETNACITHWHYVEWAYSSGFRRAAHHLAEQVCGSRSEQDVLVYPIVYLYRHHVELVLKSIIETASALLGRELPARDLKKLDRHDLAGLWEVARPLLDPVCELARNPPFPPDDLEGIDSYIRQIHEHDPDGQRFRYATIKLKGVSTRTRPRLRSPSLKPELKLVNIRLFAVAMEKLTDYIENIESWFGHLHQQQAEMQQDGYGN